jgi:hypothetical protein
LKSIPQPADIFPVPFFLLTDPIIWEYIPKLLDFKIGLSPGGKCWRETAQLLNPILFWPHTPFVMSQSAIIFASLQSLFQASSHIKSEPRMR